MPRKTDEQREAEERIRAHLRSEMERRAIVPEELARKLGVDAGTVSRILSGDRGIGLGMAIRISRVLKINLERLTEDWPEGHPPKRELTAAR